MFLSLSLTNNVQLLEVNINVLVCYLLPNDMYNDNVMEVI